MQTLRVSSILVFKLLDCIQTLGHDLTLAFQLELDICPD